MVPALADTSDRSHFIINGKIMYSGSNRAAQRAVNRIMRRAMAA